MCDYKWKQRLHLCAAYTWTLVCIGILVCSFCDLYQQKVNQTGRGTCWLSQSKLNFVCFFLCHLKCIVSLIISFEASLNFIHRTRPVAQVSYKPHEEHTSPPPYSALNFVWYWIVFIFVNLTIIKWYSFNYFELLCASFFNWFWSKHEKFYRFLIFDIFSQRNSQAHKFGYQVLLDLYTMRKFRK